MFAAAKTIEWLWAQEWILLYQYVPFRAEKRTAQLSAHPIAVLAGSGNNNAGYNVAAMAEGMAD